ncbi:hypothetical protein ACQ4LE_008722 [Meloidogyne hapla]|uniref:Myb-like domain-containing protein n=1 Tax=Meloidogyne hapla TaxID=6305 RepID=A0A1I8BZU1_MELHA
MKRQQRKKASPIKQHQTNSREERQKQTKLSPRLSLQINKKRGSRVEVKEPKFSASDGGNLGRWGSKEINNLTMALELAVNPRSDEDWDKIAETVGKGCARKRSGEECKLRAEKTGLLLASTSSTLNPVNNGRCTQLSKHARRANSMKCLFSSESEESTSEIHRKHYDEFFAKQKSPITECLDMDDTLVRVCSTEVSTHPYLRLRSTRRPFMMQVLSEDSVRDDDGDCSFSEIETNG